MRDTLDKAIAWDEIAKKNDEISQLRSDILDLRSDLRIDLSNAYCVGRGSCDCTEDQILAGEGECWDYADGVLKRRTSLVTSQDKQP